MNTKRTLEIARWEFLQRVRSKAFIISIILTPILIVGFTVIPGLVMAEGMQATKTIALLDSTGEYISQIIGSEKVNETGKVNSNSAEQMQQDLKKNIGKRGKGLGNADIKIPSFVFVDYSTGNNFATAMKKADKDAASELIDGAVVVYGQQKNGKRKIEYRSINVSDMTVFERLESMIEIAVVRKDLLSAGIDTAIYNNATKGIDVSTIKLNSKGEEEKGGGFLASFGLAYLAIILFLFLTLTTGQTLVRSMVEEKSNRIIEILVSGGTAQELMWGKLVGLTGVGLVLVGSWVLMGGIVAVYFLSTGQNMPISESTLFAVPLMLAYLVLGYFFYAAIFIGVGSLVTTEQEAQAITGYITILFTGPMAFIMVIMQNPDSTMSKALSFIPILTPSLMIIRIAIKMPSALEIIGTLVVMVLSTAFVVWCAGKIFRTAILLTGKRPTFSEALSWLKEA